MTTEAIQAVVDRDEITVSEEGVEGASRVIELAAGRDAFTYDNLLPPDLAAAVELINQEDPADALTATLIFLVGCAGLLKLGNRVKCSARYSVPMNLFIASVGPTGLSKTGHTTKLIDAPSAHMALPVVIALAGLRFTPPSVKLSGVTFKTPINCTQSM